MIDKYWNIRALLFYSLAGGAVAVFGNQGSHWTSLRSTVKRGRSSVVARAVAGSPRPVGLCFITIRSDGERIGPAVDGEADEFGL